jgi:hypothetical protein
MTNTPDIKLLRELADKATPGPWKVSSNLAKLAGDFFLQIIGPRWICMIMDDCEKSEEDAAFIAAANPQTIIALCERVEKLEAVLKPFAEYCNGRTSDLFPDDQNITLGSPMARKQLTIGDCRLARAALKGEP